MRFELDVAGEQAARPLRRLTDRLQDPRPLLQVAAAELRAIEAERFARSGPGWAQNKPATIARDRRDGLLTTPLRGRRSGPTLMRSLTAARDPSHIEIVRRSGLKFGTRNRAAGVLRRPYKLLSYDSAQRRRIGVAVAAELHREMDS